MNPQPSQEQYQGCLIGQCLGDATGYRVEGYPAFVCKNYVEYELRNQQPKDRDRFLQKFLFIKLVNGFKKFPRNWQQNY